MRRTFVLEEYWKLSTPPLLRPSSISPTEFLSNQALGWLISVPGASNTLLEAVVPYSRMSMIQLLGKVPTQFTSRQTAEELALLACNRPLKLSKPGSPVLVVGFTGCLASTGPKLGVHRFHLSMRTSDWLWVSTVTLSKVLRTQEQEERVSSQILLEISVVNVDKPPLIVSQIKDRVEQFQKVGKTVIISNQPYVYKKTELFPGSAFVIGADTAVKLINPKYYGGDYGKMLEILLGCKNTGCSFLVGGRNVDEVFKVLEDFDIPEELRDMFISIPTDKFRMDISSTEIRKSQEIRMDISSTEIRKSRKI